MDLTVTTYNLKFPDPGAPRSWAERRPLMARQLALLDADVVATQEGYHHQVREVAADGPRRYEWVGTGRDGGSRGEFCAILFDADRFEPVEYDHFWLSDTPDVIGSRTPSWGNLGCTRMATWVRLRERATGTEFVVLDTHLDNASERARLWGAELIGSRLGRFNDEPDLPVVVCGDFNAPAPSADCYRALTSYGRLRDAWLEANHGEEPKTATYNNWGEPAPGDRIDWILIRGAITATAASLGDHREDGHWPSDHLPVTTRLTTGT